MIDWRSTLVKLGVPDDILNGRNQPCPFNGCGGRDRFRFTDHNGDGCYICNQCSSGDGYGFIKNYFNVDFMEARKMVGNDYSFISYEDKGNRDAQRIQKNIGAFNNMFSRLQRAEGTPAEAYLRSRGLSLPPISTRDMNGYQYNFGVFWIPDYDHRHGALTTLITAQPQNTLSQMQYILLTDSGTKAMLPNNKLFSADTDNLAKTSFRVAPVFYGDPNRIIIAEGLENSLSCLEIFKILDPSSAPPTVYNCTNAGMLAKFKPFEGDFDKQQYLICSDNDESLTGRKAAAYAKINIEEFTGREDSCQVVRPLNKGEDWNDILMSGDRSKMMQLFEVRSV